MNRQPREATRKLLNMIDEGLLTYQMIAVACLGYMSEDEVRDMAESEGFIEDEEDEEVDEDE
jgi:hypothetical protein